MARTVPRVIRTIPSDDTFQMSANSREEMHFSGLVPEGRNLLAIEFKNLTLANFYLRKVCSFRTFQVVTQKIKRVVEVLLYIFPGSAVKFFSPDRKQVLPRIFAA